MDAPVARDSLDGRRQRRGRTLLLTLGGLAVVALLALLSVQLVVLNDVLRHSRSQDLAGRKLLARALPVLDPLAPAAPAVSPTLKALRDAHLPSLTPQLAALAASATFEDRLGRVLDGGAAFLSAAERTDLVNLLVALARGARPALNSFPHLISLLERSLRIGTRSLAVQRGSHSLQAQTLRLTTESLRIQRQTLSLLTQSLAIQQKVLQHAESLDRKLP